MSGLILDPVIAAVDAVGRGQWDWWLVAVLAVGVLVMVAGCLTRDGDER